MALPSVSKPPILPLPPSAGPSSSSYSRPHVSPPISAMVSPPKYPSKKISIPPPPPTRLIVSPTTTSPAGSSTTTLRSQGRVTTTADEADEDDGMSGTAMSSSSRSVSQSTLQNGEEAESTANHYASTDIVNRHLDGVAKMYRAGLSTPPPPRSVSIDTVSVELKEVKREHLKFAEKLGEGQFGEIHLCRLTGPEGRAVGEGRLVAVKALRVDCDQNTRSDFEHEARVLTSLHDPNLVGVIGVCFDGDPMCMVCEYTEQGDLYHYLQDHITDTSLSRSPGVHTLSYNCLIHIAAQIASGMKYLEKLNFVHRDLATRFVPALLTNRERCGSTSFVIFYL